MKRVGIIGAGRFGLSLAEALAEGGVEVLLIDRNGTLVQNNAAKVTWAIQGDGTNPQALEQAGVHDCDMVVVAIGTNTEASMLTTANCKELGVKKVVAKAISELHGRILRKLGADSVVFPDRDSANRLARTITNHDALDLLQISEGFSVAEIDAPAVCLDRTLAESDLRRKSGVTVLCVRRADPENPLKPRVIETPDADYVIRADDKLIVFGTPHDIDELVEST